MLRLNKLERLSPSSFFSLIHYFSNKFRWLTVKKLKVVQYCLALGGSTVVEQLPHHPKVKGSTPTSGTEKEKNDEHKFFQDVYDVSKPSRIILGWIYL